MSRFGYEQVVRRERPFRWHWSVVVEENGVGEVDRAEGRARTRRTARRDSLAFVRAHHERHRATTQALG